MDSLEISAGSHRDAVERFAQQWWERPAGGDAPTGSEAAVQATPLVIRAERV